MSFIPLSSARPAQRKTAPTPTPASPQRRSARGQAKKFHPLMGSTIEVSTKLGVNVVLSTIALVMLMRMVPSQLAQQEELRTLQLQVDQTAARVNQLQDDFGRYFDPSQESSIQPEHLNRIKSNQRQIIWVRPHQSRDDN